MIPRRRITVQIALLPDAAALLGQAAEQAAREGAHWNDAERAILLSAARMLARKVRELPGPLCEQCRTAPAAVYAMGPGAGDWGGRYCEPCASALGYSVTDRL